MRWILLQDIGRFETLPDHGADINFNARDMVYPYQATPLTVAARNGDLAMAKIIEGEL
ncbi:hypothetical protein NDS46_12305 [Paenibacillus thiaminolyticus]|uniref:hypothetical protein n=1 Tax=Paenibacillus thiaminolyticus TaxID=49283 RepID=UPI00232D8C47|nr:hypothetical protein [Paenibacillus thiaminolyticus]WCF11378.1 hypothetical protein NDS46_12305 [Paenibacillus thiaminolyticus]